MKEKLPDKYVEAEEWARLFLKRMQAFKKRFNSDEDFRRYMWITGGAENAALKRTSMDLSKALVKLRKP
jgi:hypothetical protein